MPAQLEDLAPQLVQFVPSLLAPVERSITLIKPGRARLPGLDNAALQLLRKKQIRLRALTTTTRTAAADLGPHVARALASTLIFAQQEAGTAVCIDSRGWIVTCAHCFGESPQEWRKQRYKWLLYYSGLAVQAECHVWDARRDLALAKVIRMEWPEAQGHRLPRPDSVYWATRADDLETASSRKTDYDLVEISQGRLRGMVPGADPHDNSDIGALKHDAWTYWGHSGAPLLRWADGTLVGLHSSWDDTTAMRHGVPLVAIREFLRAHLPTERIGLSLAPQGASATEREIIVIDSSD
ncbi:hypothetical protein N7510_010453 [Penicillium lagena]|uniref:uncharacterized protein n=1 Tax=Penicillium lagena TaxID=94218 RepID=UPI0025411688|nr:uncharacterized protein N7510_010453 [Penicillium lagena]KAJ5605299.1 hypothetical protein N7510_010453 [Penicillium lagena]